MAQFSPSDPFILPDEFTGLAPDLVRENISSSQLKPSDDAAFSKINAPMDVSQQKRSETTPQENQGQFHALAHSAPVLIWVHGLQGNEFVNKAYLDFIGADEASVRNFNWIQFVHPDDRDKYINSYREAFDRRVDFEGRLRFRRYDGEYRWMKSAAAPRFSSDGTFLGYVGSTIDITDIVNAEQSMRGSEDRYRLIAEGANDFVWDWDLRSNQVIRNEGIQKVFGYAPNDMTSDATWEQSHIHPNDRERVLCGMKAAFDEGNDFWQDEYRFQRANGTFADVLARGQILRDASGAAVRMVGSMMDLTQRRLAEKEMRFQATVLAQVNDAVIATDNHKRVTYMNNAAERQYGVTAAEALGRPIQEVYETRWDDRKEQAGAKRTLSQEGFWRGENTHIRHDGSNLLVESAVAVLKDDEGNSTGRLAVIRDISRRKRGELELAAIKDDLALQVAGLTRLHQLATRLAGAQDLESAYQAILETIVSIHGTDRGLLSVYDSESGYLTAGASINFKQSDLESLGHIKPEPKAGACGSAFATRNRVIVEDVETDPCFEGYREASRLVGFRAVHSTPILTRAGEILGVLSVHFDHPRRPTPLEMQLADMCARCAADTMEAIKSQQAMRDAKETAEAANRSKDKFLAALSHELRTPLTPALMAIGALESNLELPPAIREDITMIRRNVELEIRLIDDLLDLSRITSGKLELRLQSIDLNSKVRHICGMCRPQILEKGIKLHCEFDEKVVNVTADPARLQQILWNVIKNAVKFTPEKGDVYIATESDGNGRVSVKVRDTGIGIAPDVLPRIFDAFEQGDANVTRQFGGLGMGLAISKALVEFHQGSIRAESEGLGKGATFIIDLPAGKHSDKTSESQVQRNPSDKQAGVRVLIVEDHADSAKILARLLKTSGYVVQTANCAADALEMARRETFDVVVSDIGLPDATGYELMQQIRELHPMKGIAMSGYGMSEDIRKSHEAGFSDHIVKPVLVEQLEQTIRRLVGNGD